MFRFFQWLRAKTRDAILGGFDDAAGILGLQQDGDSEAESRIRSLLAEPKKVTTGEMRLVCPADYESDTTVFSPDAAVPDLCNGCGCRKSQHTLLGPKGDAQQ